MSDRTAQKFMAVAKSYGAKSELYSHLDASALYELAAPKTPLEVREEVEKMIEAAAKRRLADEYDAAQERGEIQKRGGGGSSKAELPTAADVGISRKDIHEARQIRDAEAAQPEILRQIVSFSRSRVRLLLRRRTRSTLFGRFVG